MRESVSGKSGSKEELSRKRERDRLSEFERKDQLAGEKGSIRMPSICPLSLYLLKCLK